MDRGTPSERRRDGDGSRPAKVATTLAALLCVVVLQGWAIRRQSLTSDEAYHSLAGLEADHRGQNSLNLEHPPLFKMLAALPQRLALPPLRVDSALANLRLLFTTPGAERRARLGGRLVLAGICGLPFLGLAFLLGREVAGTGTGAVLALALAFDFSVFPLLGLIYSDPAAAVGFGCAFLAMSRFLRRPTFASAALLGLSCGLALASKFTGLLLLPAAAATFIAAPHFRAAWRQRLLMGLAAAVLAAGVVELTYAAANRHYDSASGRDTIRLYTENRATIVVGDLLRPAARPLLRLEGLDPRAAQWLTGLLATQAQNALAVYPACNFGRMSSRGLWWYFPLLLLAKTPLPLLLASAAAVVAAGLAARQRRRRRRQGQQRQEQGQEPAASPSQRTTTSRRFSALLAGTAGLFLLAAMASNYNAGLRHLLPILPLLYLPAARWASARPHLAAALLAALLAESLALGPVWLSSTSTWWLGGHDPLRFQLSLDNVYYQQNLLALQTERDRRALQPLAVLDPALPAPQVEAYLGPGASLSPASSPPEGWLAVGVAAEVVLPAILRSSPREMYGYPRYRAIADAWWPAALRLRRGAEDHGIVAGTFHLYRLPSRGVPPTPPALRAPRSP
jgi:hypothetical protein